VAMTTASISPCLHVEPEKTSSPGPLVTGLRCPLRVQITFAYAAITLYGLTFQRGSANGWIGNSTVAARFRPREAFRGRRFDGLPDRMPSPLRDGGVYHPDPSSTGVTPASTYVAGGGILTACPSGFYENQGFYTSLPSPFSTAAIRWGCRCSDTLG
jgi:hypothetical protein